MKNSNFAKYTLVTTVALLVGFGVGKYMYEPAKGIITIDPKHTIYFSPANGDDAHQMSVRFRNAAGLCPGNASCGLFEFSQQTVRDLVVAVDSINREVERNDDRTPSFYRGIFGVDSRGLSRLIVTGLAADNREYRYTTKIVEGHLPCPWLCDINLSDVIMGASSTRNPCE